MRLDGGGPKDVSTAAEVKSVVAEELWSRLPRGIEKETLGTDEVGILSPSTHLTHSRIGRFDIWPRTETRCRGGDGNEKHGDSCVVLSNYAQHVGA